MRYLGVDFGIRKVGLAQSEGELVSPWKVLTGKNVADLVEKLKFEARNFDKLVIGLPEGKMGELVKKVIKNLRSDGLNVVEADETLSSQEAIQEMVKLNIPRKKRRINDAHSAAIILQNYLDNLTT